MWGMCFFFNHFAVIAISYKAISLWDHVLQWFYSTSIHHIKLKTTSYQWWNYCNTRLLIAYCFVFFVFFSGVFIRLQKPMSILMLHTHTQFIAIILIHLDAQSLSG